MTVSPMDLCVFSFFVPHTGGVLARQHQQGARAAAVCCLCRVALLGRACRAHRRTRIRTLPCVLTCVRCKTRSTLSASMTSGSAAHFALAFLHARLKACLLLARSLSWTSTPWCTCSSTTRRTASGKVRAAGRRSHARRAAHLSANKQTNEIIDRRHRVGAQRQARDQRQRDLALQGEGARGDSVGQARRRLRRRVVGRIHEDGCRRRASQGRRQEGRDFGAVRRRANVRHGRQQRDLHQGPHGRLECVVHDQLSGAARQGHSRQIRDHRRPHDDRARNDGHAKGKQKKTKQNKTKQNKTNKQTNSTTKTNRVACDRCSTSKRLSTVPTRSGAPAAARRRTSFPHRPALRQQSAS